MALRFRARPGRLLATAVSVVAFVAVFGGGVAMAADEPVETPSIEQLFQQLQNTPVYKDACQKTCHGSIAKTKNYASAIIFTHGYHTLVECSACHPRFPHRPEVTIERPTMKKCFDCHGVRHGPMGVIASSKCEDCHVTPRERLRPSFHTFGWAGKEHVAPSKEFNTRCAMCHEPASCTECHDEQGIEWAPATWGYDSKSGCLACHGNGALSKQAATGIKSFAITGLDESAHTELTCQQCHIDYRYDDAPSPSQLWTVNASLACAECHKTAEEGKWAAVVKEYNASTHAEAIGKGDMDSATCSSCHGGHFIYRLEDNEVAQQRMHLSAYRVCARCHDEEYGTYDDYYHGKAYKAGNADAPACWDCHAAHDVKPKSDAASTIAESNVGETCGQEGCHKGSSEKFGAAAAKLIHEKAKAQEENPLLRLVGRITGR